MPRLIVTADDAGLHEGMTAGAIKAHREGIVTACSLVANGRAIEDAIDRLSSISSMAAGVHLTLVEERPLSPPAQVASLTGPDGRFVANYRRFAMRYAAGRVRLSEVERELRGQIEMLLARGLTLTHLNGHQHLHVLPKIFEIVVRLAGEYRIGYIRTPSDAVHAVSPRTAAVRLLGHFGRRARQRLEREPLLATASRTIGVSDAGHHSLDSLIRLLDDVEGTTELVCHPGVGDDSISAAYGWGYEWDRETESLCDPGLREEIARRGIELVKP